ncbi:exodeoxyribonuclease VII small subunit [Motilimonas sp. KMU-193]|uniref:exodeoxyribonuclease VII small subunit n=1 Tax=Motilimonas sp. KMU-193 TaxID=3388668 RepID=UPI00396B465C
MATKKPENMNFEESVTELEEIVKKLELGELTLEEALKQFERGIALARVSSTKLQSAEQQVQILLERGGEQVLSPFQDEA